MQGALQLMASQNTLRREGCEGLATLPTACRYHEQAVEVFRRLKEEEGLQPDSTSYTNLIRSYLNKALGTFSQPHGNTLSECGLRSICV